MIDKIINGNVLVISPHYDDEVLGCGGTLLKYRKNISNLSIAYIVSDDINRKQEAQKVLSELQTNNVHYFSFTDGFINSSYESCVISLIKVIQKEQPSVMFIPHDREEHPDHMSVSNIAYDAAQKARYLKINSKSTPHKTSIILKYEIWTPMSKPSLVCDITNQITDKLALLEIYSSQIESFPYVDYITYLNGWRGILHQRIGYAEVFECCVL